MVLIGGKADEVYSRLANALTIYSFLLSLKSYLLAADFNLIVLRCDGYKQFYY